MQLKNNQKVAVIIPSYNAQSWIGDTLDSVVGQKRKPDQIIVVDDCSSDTTTKIVSAYKDVELIQGEGKGPNFARKLGVDQSKADYVLLLDHDDLLHPEHLLSLEELILSNDNLSYAFSLVVNIGRTTFGDWNAPIQASNLFGDTWSYFPANFIATPGQVLIDKRHLLASGGWPTFLTGCADFYMWYLLTIKAKNICSYRRTLGKREVKTSHSRVLRTEAPDFNLMNRYKASLAVARIRGKKFPREISELSYRLRYIHYMRQLVLRPALRRPVDIVRLMDNHINSFPEITNRLISTFNYYLSHWMTSKNSDYLITQFDWKSIQESFHLRHLFQQTHKSIIIEIFVRNLYRANGWVFISNYLKLKLFRRRNLKKWSLPL